MCIPYGSVAKNLLAMQLTQKIGSMSGLGRCLEEEMASHYNIAA